MSDSEQALLIVFGDLLSGAGTVSADVVFKTLHGSQVWYVARLPSTFRPGMAAAFYQNGKGIVGTAKIIAAVATPADDGKRLPWLPANQYKVKLMLADCHTYKEPLPIYEGYYSALFVPALSKPPR